jgi:hypothetical protein
MQSPKTPAVEPVRQLTVAQFSHQGRHDYHRWAP